jgi:hypothetical protein
LTLINHVGQVSSVNLYAPHENFIARILMGYALGTGNSIPEYVPDDKYFAMISVALEG